MQPLMAQTGYKTNLQTDYRVRTQRKGVVKINDFEKFSREIVAGLVYAP